ncbi:MAG: cell division protein SepF [Oscillospiraceae bacterium]|nr:cell division protein SepF [Oscillospiraceae bacterium]
MKNLFDKMFGRISEEDYQEPDAAPEEGEEPYEPEFRQTQAYDGESQAYSGASQAYGAASQVYGASSSYGAAASQASYGGAPQTAAQSFGNTRRFDNVYDFTGKKASSRPTEPEEEFTYTPGGGSGGGSGLGSGGFGGGPAAEGPFVVLVLPKEFDDADRVVEHMVAPRVVIMNLEGCDESAAGRIYYYVRGAAKACASTINRIAGRTFIITPKNVPYEGDLLESFREAAEASDFDE